MGTQITGGVDTHLDVHVVAALDEHGVLVATASFVTTPAGYRELTGWLASLGEWYWSVSKGPVVTALG
jgi:transposase